MKLRQCWVAITSGLGLTVVLMLLLIRPAALVRADQGVYYVREGGSSTDCITVTAPCGSIQHAINLAGSPGDEVWVAAGVYTENLTITHSVKLRGGWDISFTVQAPVTYPTIVDGSDVSNTAVVSALVGSGSALIEGFTLRSGQDGIHILTGSVTVERCTIRDVAKQGFEIEGGNVLISATRVLTAQRGIEVDGGVVQVADAHIAHLSEEGLLIERGGTVTFTGSTIEDCTQQGVQINKGRLWLFDNLIRDIQADGIRIEGGVVSVISNTIRDTLADGVDVSGTQVISGNLITGSGDHGISAHDGASVIVNNVVSDTGTDGIHTTDTSTNVEIRGNTVYNTASDGIDSRGQTVAIVSNTIYDTHGDGIRTRESADVEIRDNVVYSTSNDGDGIDARGQAITLTSNLVHDVDKDGIHVEGTSVAIVQRNTLYDVNDDGIDASGGTVLVANNHVNGCGDNSIKAEEADHTFINANQVYGAGDAGIDLDDAGAFTVTNNIVAGSSGAGVLVETIAGPHNFLYHNTLVGSATGQQSTGISVTVTGITITLANNIVVSHTVGITATTGATLVVSNTLLWSNGSDPITGTDVITASPLFVAPASYDYHLLPDSPAVDTGIDVGILTDVDGEPRLGIPDVGADEVLRKVYLPLTLRAHQPGALLNPGFEGIHCDPGSPPGWCYGNWTRDTHDGRAYGNIFTPQGWVTWWRAGDDYGQPEVCTIPRVDPFIEPLARIRSGNYAVRLFTFYRLQDTGLYQVVTDLPPSTTVQLSAYAHAWSCNNDEHAPYSCGDLDNMGFRVGIDPDGGADPWSANIVWSERIPSPDEFHLIGPVAAQAGPAGCVTVFLRSDAKQAYKHNDAYWDDVLLTVQSP